MNVKFMDWNCTAMAKRYTNNGRTAIELIETDTGEPIAISTVNLVEEALGPNEVIIKDYSENTGMREALINAGVIHPEELRRIETGFVTCPVHKLTDKFLETVTE